MFTLPNLSGSVKMPSIYNDSTSIPIINRYTAAVPFTSDDFTSIYTGYTVISSCCFNNVHADFNTHVFPKRRAPMMLVFCLSFAATIRLLNSFSLPNNFWGSVISQT